MKKVLHTLSDYGLAVVLALGASIVFGLTLWLATSRSAYGRDGSMQGTYSLPTFVGVNEASSPPMLVIGLPDGSVLSCALGADGPAQMGGDESGGMLPIYSLAHWNQENGRQSFAVNNQGQRLEATWTSGGVQQRVITDRHDNEPADVWVKRHKDAVTAALAYLPPDHPQHNSNAQGATHRGLDDIVSDWNWIPQGYVDPVAIELGTERHQGETTIQWLGRHREGVAAAVVEMPRS